MIKLILTAIALSLLLGYMIGSYVESNDKQQTIRELAAVICIANGGVDKWI